MDTFSIYHLITAKVLTFSDFSAKKRRKISTIEQNDA